MYQNFVNQFENIVSIEQIYFASTFLGSSEDSHERLGHKREIGARTV
jgi:hypothetical protein